MTPSVISVQRLAFFSLRIPDSELGCDVGSVRDPIKRGVVRPRSVTFSSSSMHNRDEILVAKGRRRAGDGDGQATATAQTAQGASPKTALWSSHLTENRTLAQTAQGASRKSAVWLVRGSQNALFRKMRFSSPGQTSSRLTENRTLQPAPHGKAHSSPAASRKSALCSRSSIAAGPKSAFCPVTSRKSALWPRQPRAPHGKAQFGRSEARRMRLSVRTRAQSALSRDVPCPECAFP